MTVTIIWPMAAGELRLGGTSSTAAHWMDVTSRLGRTRWAIPEGYIPGTSVDADDPTLLSHETACLLNLGSEDALVSITIYFEARDPAGPFTLSLGAQRTKHLRFNDLRDPETIPRDMPYASVIESSVPIIVQHTRLDSRNPNIALLSTIAFPLD